MQLEQNDALQLGSLENGLRWVILPNRSPPARFEAHLEVHAGSGAQWPPLLAPSLLLAACLAV